MEEGLANQGRWYELQQRTALFALNSNPLRLNRRPSAAAAQNDLQEEACPALTQASQATLEVFLLMTHALKLLECLSFLTPIS